MKKFTAILAAAFMAVTLSACGENVPDVSETSEAGIEETEIEEDNDIDEEENDETDFQTTKAEEKPDNTQSNGEYKYIVDGDHIKLTEYLGNEAEVTIPSEIDGAAVTVIGEQAFQGCENLKKAFIPDSVVQIEGLAFAGCTNLTEVNIPETISTIEGLTFDGCESLTEITIPESVTKIETWAFLNCSGLKKIVIPDSVTEIEVSAFDGCICLSDVTVPEHFDERDFYMAFDDTPWFKKNYQER